MAWYCIEFFLKLVLSSLLCSCLLSPSLWHSLCHSFKFPHTQNLLYKVNIVHCPIVMCNLNANQLTAEKWKIVLAKSTFLWYHQDIEDNVNLCWELEILVQTFRSHISSQDRIHAPVWSIWLSLLVCVESWCEVKSWSQTRITLRYTNLFVPGKTPRVPDVIMQNLCMDVHPIDIFSLYWFSFWISILW